MNRVTKAILRGGAMFAALGLVAPGAAMAQMVQAADPASLVRELQGMGYRAELTRDDSGDPLIRSASSGTDFLILFYGCEDGKSCDTVQFFAGFSDPENGSVAAMNIWNSKNRFSRAYIAESGAARIELDLDLDDGGMSSALFRDNIEFWTIVMARFESYVRNES